MSVTHIQRDSECLACLLLSIWTVTSKQMNRRRKYINQAFTQPGSGFSTQGHESALSPPTSFLIQLVSICPGSQFTASQSGETSSCNSPAHCLLPNRNILLNRAWWRLASLPSVQGCRGAENSYHLQPLWFPAPAQVQVQTCPSHTSPHLGPRPCQLHTPVGGFPTF